MTRYSIEIAPCARLPRWNPFVLALFVLAGEWTLHQLVYRIEYGARFAAVMASTPHRFYMQPLGMALGILLFGLAVSGLVALASLRAQRSHLARRGGTSVGASLIPDYRMVLALTIIIAFFQLAVYFFQENVESAVEGYGWPALSVLVSPNRLIVFPLAVAIAGCIALTLCVFRTHLSEARCAIRRLRSILALTLGRKPSPRLLVPLRLPLPTGDHLSRIGSPRAPPVAA
ncbi:MAG: hypothetical protein ACRDFS_10710 [Chloroflexota bacterium]